ncbi:MAG: rhomboid family intramembrane serine protease [bacterium]|nr:rhomboid family intramembrane serine protease [bacterium]
MMLGLGAQFACGALLDWASGDGPRWVQAGLGAGLVASFLVVMISGFKSLRLLQSGPVTLCVERMGLRLLTGNAESIAFLPHHEILSLEIRRFPFPAWFAGSGIGIPWSARLRHFDNPEDARNLIDEMRTRIGELPDGTAQLEALDKRNGSGSQVGTGWPRLSSAIVFVLASIAAFQFGLDAMDRESLVTLGANSGERMLQGEFWRPWTAGLLHGSFLHIAANSLWFLLVGLLLERLLGGARFALLIGLSSLAGCLVAALAHPGQVGIGASAGGMGAIGAWMGLHLWRRKELPGSLRLTGANLAWFLLMLVAAEFVVVTTGHVAHVGGFLAGLVLVPILLGRVPLHELHQRVPPALKAGALLVGLTYFAALGSILISAAGLSRG